MIAPEPVVHAAPVAHRRVVRSADGRVVGGVAGGIAEHLGLSPLLLRLAFVVLAVANGLGVVLYGVFWLLLPQSAAPRRGLADRHRLQVLALAAIGVGGLLLVQQVGAASPLMLPLLLAAAGVGLVWQQADEAQRARWQSARGRPGRLVVVAGGALLLVAGLAGVLAVVGLLGAAREGLLLSVLVVGGLAVLTGPWWLRMTADLRAERRERIRSQERAEVAAHVHDSVLQTLALIRKAADDPREVTRLARAQERDLRSWLYAPAREQAAFAAALEQVAAEVEEAHGVTVDVVVVGDCPTTPHLLAVVAAAREALANAARHSGASTASLYAEVDDAQVAVYVRDRGRGFDPAQVPPDRFGVAQSVVGRMARHGGTAEVRTSPGAGTEVRLELSRG